MKGQRNRWRKADLAVMREHLQRVLDEYPGGIEGFLSKLLADRRRGWSAFVALLRQLVPKPPTQVQPDAKIVVSWAESATARERAAPTPQSADERTAG